MAGLDNLNTRLNYYGKTQHDRFIDDKLRSLRQALLYSYQRAIITLQDERQFLCLMNPDKVKDNYDDKVISIPFDDICLNSPRKGKTTVSREVIGMKPGDTFFWEATNTYWIVTLRLIQELAYFKATVRRCDYEIDIYDKYHYHVYVRGPEETQIDWKSMQNAVYNGLNYNIVLTVTKDEITSSFFKRFAKLKVNGRNWEVQATDDMSREGIIDVYLKEYFTNSIEEEQKEYEKENPPEQKPDTLVRIIGEETIYPYDIKSYKVEGLEKGIWSVDNKKIKILSQDESECKIEVMSGKSCSFNLTYITENEDAVTLKVIVASL